MEKNLIAKLKKAASSCYSHKGKIILFVILIFISKKSYDVYKLMRPYYDMYKELKGIGSPAVS